MFARFEIEKFDGHGDFSLWRRKLKALLVLQKVGKVLDKPELWAAGVTKEKREEMEELAYSTIILHLADNLLPQLDGVETPRELWSKLESLYVSKSSKNKIYLKARLFGFRMQPSKSLEENLDDFYKICVALSDIGEKLDDEDKAVILLNSLPECYNEVKAAIKYGRDSLTLASVVDALRSKDFETEIEKNDAEALMIRERSESKGKSQGENTKHGSKSKGKEKRKCYYCRKEGHLIKDCFLRKNKNKREDENDEQTANLHEGYESTDVLIVSENAVDDGWILDSGCSYHITR